MIEKAIVLRPRRRRRNSATPKAGWDMVVTAAQRLGLWDSLFAHAARRAFSAACHRLVPRLEPQARAEGLDASGKALLVRVSSSAVASELVYVKDLLLDQVNAELDLLRPRSRTGKPGAALHIERLQYRVGSIKTLPDYAAWSAQEALTPRNPQPPLKRAPWDLEVAAALTSVPDQTTRDALAALYAAAVSSTPTTTNRR